MGRKTPFYSLSTGVACVMTLFLSVSSAPSVLGSDSDRSLVIRVGVKEKLQPPKGKAEVIWEEVSEPGVKKKHRTIKGYRVYMGTAPRSYTSSIDVGGRTKYVFKHLPSGTYYFAVTAYTDAGQESPYSVEVSKTIPDKD